MNVKSIIKRLTITSMLAVVSVPSYAESAFSSKDFLEWEEPSRRSYIQTSLIMANMIASENDKAHAKCIDDWYGSDRRGKEQFIYGLMKKHPDAHPIALIVAVVEKQCGSFKYVDAD